MFNFRRDQNKFNNNGGYPSLGNMNRGKITPGGDPQGFGAYSPGSPEPTAGIGPYEQAQNAPMNNPYQNLSRDRYLNERYRNPMRQRMDRIGKRRRRPPMDLRKMQFMQNMMRNRQNYGV